MEQEALNAPGWTIDPADTYQIAQETGPGSINSTERWNVYGTDLGHMFLYQSRMFMVFGDTFGPPAADPFFSVSHTDWRSNTMAELATSRRPDEGLAFLGMVTDRPGHAKELLVEGSNVTVIPTYGVSVGSRMFLYYMAVRQWGQAGHWTLNYSGISYSDDEGNTWTRADATWPGDSNFGQVALVARDDWVHVFGIPGGRYGSLRLARVPADSILQKSSYAYWNGRSWSKNDPGAAVEIVPAPVGELSVQYNSYYQKWLMMYLVDSEGRIVLRMADSLTGPWDPARTVVTRTRHPQLYAPYITPLWNDSPDIYFMMSRFGPYQVLLMHTSLTATPARSSLGPGDPAYGASP